MDFPIFLGDNAVRSRLVQGAIDMTDVAMIDSIGLGVLIAAHNFLNKKGGKLSVNHVSDHIFSLFKTMRLDKHFDVNLSGS